MKVLVDMHAKITDILTINVRVCQFNQAYIYVVYLQSLLHTAFVHSNFTMSQALVLQSHKRVEICSILIFCKLSGIRKDLCGLGWYRQRQVHTFSIIPDLTKHVRLQLISDVSVTIYILC